tara:strand:+ start:6659 stop:7309 length:651 start_codon:yes stop_codon:yes gene_type:complete
MDNLQKYNSFIFDCDGVILNSNQIKTNAFFEVAKKFGSKHADKLVNFHIENGGISRYKKFMFFLENILENKEAEYTVEALCKEFSTIIIKDLINSEVNQEIFQLKEIYNNNPWLVVSGGDQAELRTVFKSKKIDSLFEGGIYGSPIKKTSIFMNLLHQGIIKNPSIYFGDSKYDYESSKQCGIDFCFVSNWTEVKDWNVFCEKNKIDHINNFLTLC